MVVSVWARRLWLGERARGQSWPAATRSTYRAPRERASRLLDRAPPGPGRAAALTAWSVAPSESRLLRGRRSTRSFGDWLRFADNLAAAHGNVCWRGQEQQQGYSPKEPGNVANGTSYSLRKGRSSRRGDHFGQTGGFDCEAVARKEGDYPWHQNLHSWINCTHHGVQEWQL